MVTISVLTVVTKVVMTLKELHGCLCVDEACVNARAMPLANMVRVLLNLY